MVDNGKWWLMIPHDGSCCLTMVNDLLFMMNVRGWKPKGTNASWWQWWWMMVLVLAVAVCRSVLEQNGTRLSWLLSSQRLVRFAILWKAETCQSINHSRCNQNRQLMYTNIIDVLTFVCFMSSLFYLKSSFNCTTKQIDEPWIWPRRIPIHFCLLTRVSHHPQVASWSPGSRSICQSCQLFLKNYQIEPTRLNQIQTGKQLPISNLVQRWKRIEPLWNQDSNRNGFVAFSNDSVRTVVLSARVLL